MYGLSQSVSYGMSKGDIDSITSENQTWGCTASSRKSMRLDSSVIGEKFILDDIMEEIKKIKKEQKDLNKALDLINKKIDDNKKAIDEPSFKINEYLKIIEELTAENLQQELK